MPYGDAQIIRLDHAADDAEATFLADFVAALTEVMDLDRFDLHL